MGFYECIYDCGDGNYCVDCASSLDGFKSPPSWLFICDKHKLAVGQIWQSYSLTNFISKYGKKSHMFPLDQKFQVKVIGYEPYKNFHLVKLQVEQFDTGILDEKKQIYFSQFSDEPAWTVSNGKTILIDIFVQNNIKRVRNTNPDICYDWNKNQVRQLIDKEKEEYNGLSFNSHTVSTQTQTTDF